MLVPDTLAAVVLLAAAAAAVEVLTAAVLLLLLLDSDTAAVVENPFVVLTEAVLVALTDADVVLVDNGFGVGVGGGGQKNNCISVHIPISDCVVCLSAWNMSMR